MSKKDQLLGIIADILEEDEVGEALKLGEGNWDSLAVVSFISEVDSEFDVVLSPTKVAEASSVADLISMV